MEGGEKNSSYQNPRRILHLRSLRLGGGEKTGKGKKQEPINERYKRNGTPRIEWPFGLMPNYFLPVKRKREERGV